MAQISSVPLISALPQFGAPRPPDDLAAASPILQALLSQTGGNLKNVNSLAASQLGFGESLSLMSPGGGLSPQQSAQFGPLFGLLMSLMGSSNAGPGMLP